MPLDYRPDIVVNPAPNDIMRYLDKAMTHIVESSSTFTRWMKGTCIQCPPVVAQGREDEEPYVYSFYNDISKNPHVVKIMISLSESIHKTFYIIGKVRSRTLLPSPGSWSLLLDLQLIVHPPLLWHSISRIGNIMTPSTVCGMENELPSWKRPGNWILAPFTSTSVS